MKNLRKNKNGRENDLRGKKRNVGKKKELTIPCMCCCFLAVLTYLPASVVLLFFRSVVLLFFRPVGGGVGVASSVDYCFATDSADVKLSELAVGIGPFVVGPAVERKIGLAAMSELAINATEWRNADWAKKKIPILFLASAR